MSKLRIFYIVSLVIVGVLSVSVFLWPMAGGRQNYSEVSRESLLETKDGWILQFDILNHEGKDFKYTVQVTVADEQYGDRFLVHDGTVYTYIHNIRRDEVATGEVSVAVYKQGEDIPFEQGTYYIIKPE